VKLHDGRRSSTQAVATLLRLMIKHRISVVKEN
jgi:hypothetical protein